MSIESRRFRVAIAGAGLISQEAHIPAAMSTPGVQLVALVDTNVQRATKVAENLDPRPDVRASIQEVLSDVDGVLVATPNHTHAEVATVCVERNVPVLIEKPLATTLEQCETIAAAAKKTGAAVAVGFCTRFRTNVEHLKQLLDNGFFGKVHRFVHRYGTVGGWSPQSGYILQRSSVGGGVLVVSGSHFLDRMLYLFGYPMDMTYADNGGTIPESDCVAEFEFGGADNGLRGMVRYSKTTAMKGSLVLETDAGIVILDDTDEAEITLRPKDAPDLALVVRWPNEVAEARPGNVFIRQLADFRQACIEKRPPRVDLEQGIMSVRLAAELYARRTELQHDWYGATEERN